MKMRTVLWPLAGILLLSVSGCLTTAPDGWEWVTECEDTTSATIGVNQDGEGEVRAGVERKCKRRLVQKPQTPSTSTLNFFGWFGGYLSNGQWQNFGCMFSIDCTDPTIGYKTTLIPDVRVKFLLSEGSLKSVAGQFVITARNGTLVRQQSFPYHVEGNEIVPSDKYAIAAWLANNSAGTDGEQISVAAYNIPLNVPASQQTRVISVTAIPSVNGIMVDGGAPASRTIRPQDIGPRIFYQER